MTIRKALVLNNGEIQQLQAGDNLDDDDFFLQRTFTATVIPGEVVYADGAGTVARAQANAAGTSDVLGLAPEAVTATFPGPVQFEGVLTLTTVQWDAVTGDTGGLVTKAKYWLSPTTIGGLTQTAPTTIGQYVVELGQALSTTELNIRIRRRILL